MNWRKSVIRTGSSTGPRGTAIAPMTERERAIEMLPGGYKQVLVWHEIDGLTHQQIADRLGIDRGTSKSQLHKARRMVRMFIDSGWLRRDDGYDFIYLSLGAGVQSSALLVMSALGLYGCPKADRAIYADTQDDPPWVYDMLDALTPWAAGHGIDVERVTHGSLSDDVFERNHRGSKQFVAIPAFIDHGNGQPSILRRQCTTEYKIRPIQARVREILGYGKGQPIVHSVAALIGISWDEAQRTKDSRESWVTNRYPLVDARLTKADCQRILQDQGLPEAKKSACVFCPFHSDAHWAMLKAQHPGIFAGVVEFDEIVRDMKASGIEDPVFLHRSLQPLRDVDFTSQADLFADLECEGYCGV